MPLSFRKYNVLDTFMHNNNLIFNVVAKNKSTPITYNKYTNDQYQLLTRSFGMIIYIYISLQWLIGQNSSTFDAIIFIGMEKRRVSCVCVDKSWFQKIDKRHEEHQL